MINFQLSVPVPSALFPGESRGDINTGLKWLWVFLCLDWPLSLSWVSLVAFNKY